MIKDVFTAMDPLLKAKVAGLTHEFGAENEIKTSAPPRIVWVPTDDSFGAAKQGNRDGAGNSSKSPRQLFLVMAGVRIRFWGTPDYGDAWSLVQTFVQQLYQVPIYGAHAFRLDRGAWDPGNASLAREGRSYHLWCAFGVPLVEASPTVASTAGFPQTPEADFPSPPPTGHTENPG